MSRFNVRRLALIALFVVARFACTGRPTVFAGRKPVRAVRRWLRDCQQGTGMWIGHVRRRVADWLIRFAERLAPLPQATPMALAEEPAPSVQETGERAEAIPVPTPLPADVLAMPNAAQVTAKGGRRRPKANSKPVNRKADQGRERKYQLAFVFVSQGSSVRDASKKAGVPQSSFRAWLKKRRSEETAAR